MPRRGMFCGYDNASDTGARNQFGLIIQLAYALAQQRSWMRMDNKAGAAAPQESARPDDKSHETKKTLAPEAGFSLLLLLALLRRGPTQFRQHQ